MKFFRILTLIVTLFLQSTTFKVSAYTNEEFEKSLYDVGYKEVQQALKESQKHFKKEIPLPVQIPSLPFTHSFGRFSNLEGELNDGFDVEYFNKEAPQNHYMIDVRPLKYKMIPPKRTISKVIKLKDGSDAIIFNRKIVSGFYVLLFENDDWQYRLSLDIDNPQCLDIKTLIDIANSMK
jgi:hypothetical protein